MMILAGALVPRLVLAVRPASSEAPENTASAGFDPTWKPLLERVLLGVALVGLAAGIGVGWYRRWRNRPATTVAEYLQLAAGLNLPFGIRLVLLRIQDRPFLIALDASGIKSFLPLPKPPSSQVRQEIGPQTSLATSRLEVRA